MELVEGETIADRLARTAPSGGLVLDEVLTYSTQIADALDRAHRHGIVHRDLKPGNVIITKSGTKLLDFGLAKILTGGGNSDAAMVPTAVGDLTMQGTIVGTLHYMAPEQVEARDTDVRTDIFAFGALLYEMATGEKAFPGRSQASVIAAILDRDPPPVSSRRALSPPELDWVVASCLAKEPDDRWQSARDLARALRWISQRPNSNGDGGLRESTPPGSRLRWIAGAALTCGVVTGAVAAWAWLRPAPLPIRGETRFSIEMPFTLRSSNWVSTQAAIAPDGSRIVYQGGRDPDRVLYLRTLGETTGRRIDGTEGADNPFFASDGKSIGFFAGGELKKISLLGGPAVKICDAPDVPYGATWYRDTIVFTNRTGLAAVAASGGTPRNLTTGSEKSRRGGHRSPVFLPGGETVIFVALYSDDLPGAIEAVELASGTRHVLVSDLRPESRGVQYLSSGHLLYEQNQSLVARAFDARTLKVDGSALPVHQGVATLGSTVAQFAVSDTGTLVYIPHANLPAETLTWVNRDGSEKALPFPPGLYQSPRISPDGSRLIVVGYRGFGAPILLANLTTGTFGELPRQKGSYGPAPIPAWTPDGMSVTYTGSNQRDLMIQPVDRSSAERVLFTPPSLAGDGSWTHRADGDVVAIATDPGDVWLWSSPEGKPSPLIQTPFSETSPAFSPDGRWLAYTSMQTSAAEIWVQPFPNKGKAVQVSVGGGSGPAWGPGGRELFYLQGDTLMAVSVTTTPEFSRSPPNRLLDLSRYNLEGRSRNYDVDPVTGRLLMVMTVGGPAPRAELVVAVDWRAAALERVKP